MFLSMHMVVMVTACKNGDGDSKSMREKNIAHIIINDKFMDMFLFILSVIHLQSIFFIVVSFLISK